MKWSPNIGVSARESPSVRQRGWRRALRSAAALIGAPWLAPTPSAQHAASGEVVEIKGFGSNPGRLRMFVYAPTNPPRPGAPLVLVLHGCAQSAASFASNSGWIAAAERFGVPLLLPEQTSSNNRGRCFSWFRPTDTSRGHGEVMSIRQMTVEAIKRFGTTQRSVFVVGLSAGGAMTASLLAAYPDVFEAGAVVAGLPAGCALNAAQGLSRMANAATGEPVTALAAKARALGPSGYQGPWPRLAVWTGDNDRTVDPRNASLLAGQWAALHGVGAEPSAHEQVNATAERSTWGPSANPTIELWRVAGLAHGYPITAPVSPAQWILPASVSATNEIARFWGLNAPAGLFAPFSQANGRRSARLLG
jgi:poly(hydroxyalkanoate) depolymerase family esterase